MIKLKTHILTIALLLFTFATTAQTYINCYAPQFKGQVATLYTYTDYISMNLEELDKGIISDSGVVEFNVNPDQGKKAFIQIQDNMGIMYLDPNTKEYYLTFPEIIDNAQRLNGNYVRLIFENLEVADLNTLIMDFNIELDNFLYGDSAALVRFKKLGPAFRDSLDQFTTDIVDKYKGEGHRYFQDYYTYTLASINLFSDIKNQDKNKFIIFETFIKEKPILYHNDAYMGFIKEFYRNSLSDITLVNRDKATHAVNVVSSYEKLDDVLYMNYYFKNDIMREFIMVNALHESFYSNFYEPNGVRQILSYISKNATVDEHKNIAREVIALQEQMQIGMDAPEFSWVNKDNDSVSIKDLEGKYVYVGFWASWNKTSIQDLYLLSKMYDKYKKHVEFVTISLDSDIQKYSSFISGLDPNEYRWQMGHYNGNAQILNDYNLRNVPIYFLIDPNGKLTQSPALSPSPSGNFKSIDETFFSIKKNLEPKRRFQVGSK